MRICHDIELGGRCSVSQTESTASHEDDLTDLVHDIRCLDDRNSEVRHRPENAYRYPVIVRRKTGFDDEINRMPVFQLRQWLFRQA